MSSDDEIFEVWEGEETPFQRMMRGCKALPQGNPAKLKNIFTGLQNGTLDINEMPGPSGRDREISVPIQTLDKCGVCFKTTSLRLCNSCASVCWPVLDGFVLNNPGTGNILLQGVPKGGLAGPQNVLLYVALSRIYALDLSSVQRKQPRSISRSFIP